MLLGSQLQPLELISPMYMTEVGATEVTAGAIVKEINLAGRIAKSGMTTRQAGDFFGWGAQQIRKPLSTFSPEMLEAAGWNAENLSSVAEGYERLAAATPNPSAAMRAQQLRSLANLFGN